jgi:hypothetical protein
MKRKLTIAAALLGLALVVFAASAFRYQSAGQRWEYRVTTDAETTDKSAGDELKLAGLAGWELVTVESGPKGRTYFFKRPKE